MILPSGCGAQRALSEMADLGRRQAAGVATRLVPIAVALNEEVERERAGTA
jgi:hypothetical protein